MCNRAASLATAMEVLSREGQAKLRKELSPKTLG